MKVTLMASTSERVKESEALHAFTYTSNNVGHMHFYKERKRDQLQVLACTSIYPTSIH